MKTPKKTDPRLPTYSSMAHCHAHTKLTVAFLKRIKAAGCPAFDRNGRIDLAKLLPWIPRVLNQKTELPAGYSSWPDYLNSVRAKRESVRTQKEAGELMPTVNAEHQAREAMAFVFANLERMFLRELPPLLDGMPAVKIAGELENHFSRFWTEAAEKFKAVGKAK